MGGSDFFDGFAGDPAGLFPKFGDFSFRKRFDAAFWVDAGAPENFVGHPVADSGESFLHEQRGFDGNFFPSREKFFDEGAGEGAFLWLRRQIGPPGGSVLALMELDAAKLPRVMKDERALLLKQDEMIVFAGREVGGFGRELSSHAEMNAEPNVAGETEEHAFAVTFGFQEFRAGQRFLHRVSIDAAGDAFLRVDVDARDCLSDSDIPASSVKFDFRQFGHDRMLTRDRMNGCSK